MNKIRLVFATFMLTLGIGAFLPKKAHASNIASPNCYISTSSSSSSSSSSSVG